LSPVSDTTEPRRRFLTPARPLAIEALPPSHHPIPSVDLMPAAARRCRRVTWYSQVGQSESLT
jgi:hypothetical protein